VAIPDNEAECILRDHLLLAHPTTLRPATRSTLLVHFQVDDVKDE